MGTKTLKDHTFLSIEESKPEKNLNGLTSSDIYDIDSHFSEELIYTVFKDCACM